MTGPPGRRWGFRPRRKLNKSQSGKSRLPAPRDAHSFAHRYIIKDPESKILLILNWFRVDVEHGPSFVIKSSFLLSPAPVVRHQSSASAAGHFSWPSDLCGRPSGDHRRGWAQGQSDPQQEWGSWQKLMPRVWEDQASRTHARLCSIAQVLRNNKEKLNDLGVSNFN